jgi:hypothetical protein
MKIGNKKRMQQYRILFHLKQQKNMKKSKYSGEEQKEIKNNRNLMTWQTRLESFHIHQR